MQRLIPLLLFLFALLGRLILVAVTPFDGLYGQEYDDFVLYRITP